VSQGISPAKFHALVKSFLAANDCASAICFAPLYNPGGKPVNAPASVPISPIIVVNPVLLIAPTPLKAP